PVWSTDLQNGYYHPLVYHTGLLYCNGKVLNANDGTSAYTLEGTFNWSAGAFVTLEDGVTEVYYVPNLYKVYAVEAQTGNVLDEFTFKDTKGRETPNSSSCSIAYSADQERLYWGGYFDAKLYSIQINLQDGKFNENSFLEAAASKSMCPPVIYRDRVYLGGQDGRVWVLEASDLSFLYKTSNNLGKIQSMPILCTAYAQPCLYVQAYNHPSSIYVLEEDYDDSNEASLKAVAVPSVDNAAAYSYEHFSFDPSGALYFYNEAGYLFKFAVTQTCLNSLVVPEAIQALEFDPQVKEYQVGVPADLTEATLQFTVPVGQSCQVKANGESVQVKESDNQYQAKIPLTAGQGTAQITVRGGSESEVSYNLNFVGKAQLQGLTVWSQDSSEASQLTLTPAFDPAVLTYTAAKDLEASNTYDSLCPVVESGAELKVTPVSGVSQIVTSSRAGQTCYNVYFAEATAVVQIEVASETAQATAYQITLQGDKSGGGGGSTGGAEDSITVTFSLQGDQKGNTYEKNGSDDYEIWIEEEQLTLNKSEAINGNYLTVADAFFKALDQAGISYEEEAGYVSGINDLYEFDNGPNSGWMYQLNGEHVQLGLRECAINDGDIIFWHYVRDYTQESEMPDDADSSSGSSGGTESIAASFEADVQKGLAKYKITESDLEALLNKVQNDSEFKGYLEFKLTVLKSLQSLVKACQVQFPLSQLGEILTKQEHILGLKLSCTAGYLAVLDNYLTTLAQNKKDSLNLQITPLSWDSLTLEQQKLVDKKPLLTQYQLFVGEQEITTLSGGTLDLGMPYVLPEGKNLSSCYLYRLEGNTLTSQLISGYDSGQKLIYFKSDKPGIYVLTDKALITEPVASTETTSEPVNEALNPDHSSDKAFNSSFEDIDGNPYASSIIKLEKAGLLTGDGQGKFNPQQELNHNMLAAFLAKLNGIGNLSYAETLTWAEAQGLMQASGQEAVDRENLAVVLCNYLEYVGRPEILSGEPVICNDLLSIREDNRNKVNQILTGGIMSKDAMDNFNPQEIILRDCAASVLEKFFDKL
ncbi:MAG: DUF4430 domain-containing protein, partial [Clostridia bacterium]|nr:DUF4430 domain-containing protein [Clostridia bacterium]